jgi:hypothetical protein
MKSCGKHGSPATQPHQAAKRPATTAVPHLHAGSESKNQPSLQALSFTTATTPPNAQHNTKRSAVPGTHASHRNTPPGVTTWTRTFCCCCCLHRDALANMSDHTTSGTLLQELVPCALALKHMLHELSMSLSAGHDKGGMDALPHQAARPAATNRYATATTQGGHVLRLPFSHATTAVSISPASGKHRFLPYWHYTAEQQGTGGGLYRSHPRGVGHGITLHLTHAITAASIPTFTSRILY